MYKCDQNPSETNGLLIATTFIILATAVLVALTLSPDSRTNTVAVVYPMGISAMTTLQKTIELGGDPISISSSGKVVVANFAQIPDLFRLWNSGALMAIDPLVAVGCSPVPRKIY